MTATVYSEEPEKDGNSLLSESRVNAEDGIISEGQSGTLENVADTEETETPVVEESVAGSPTEEMAEGVESTEEDTNPEGDETAVAESAVEPGTGESLAEREEELENSILQDVVSEIEMAEDEMVAESVVTTEGALTVPFFEEKGRVYDFENERGIAGATVNFTSRQSGKIFTAVTGQKGNYSIFMTSGIYEVTVEKDGFYKNRRVVCIGKPDIKITRR